MDPDGRLVPVNKKMVLDLRVVNQALKHALEINTGNDSIPPPAAWTVAIL
jgi:hypothetical protein